MVECNCILKLFKQQGAMRKYGTVKLDAIC